jgi:predicted HTH domain antitoxin
MSSTPVPPQTKTHTLAVTLPERVVRLLGQTPQEAAQRLKELALVELFRQGTVSSGWAAEQLGIRKADFLDLLFSHDVACFDLSEDDLRQQVDVATTRNGQSTS